MTQPRTQRTANEITRTEYSRRTEKLMDVQYSDWLILSQATCLSINSFLLRSTEDFKRKFASDKT